MRALMCSFFQMLRDSCPGMPLQNPLNSGSYSGCTFTRQDGNGYFGAAFNSDSQAVTISNCVFSRCETANYGGAIHACGSTVVTMTSTNFASCKVTYESGWGGCIYIRDKAELVATSCSFEECSAGHGAVIYQGYTYTDSPTVTLSHATIKNCRSTGSGGAILLQYGKTTVTSSSFEGCTAGAKGGVIVQLNSATALVFENSTATYCYSQMSGAVISSAEGSISVKNVTFKHCFAQSDGGAISVDVNPHEKIGDCTFTDIIALNCTCNGIGSCIAYGRSAQSIVIDGLTCTDCSSKEGATLHITGASGFTASRFCMKNCGDSPVVAPEAVDTTSGCSAQPPKPQTETPSTSSSTYHPWTFTIQPMPTSEPDTPTEVPVPPPAPPAQEGGSACPTPEDKGLPAGAIVAIVILSIVVFVETCYIAYKCLEPKLYALMLFNKIV